jgi:hypothetical protein
MNVEVTDRPACARRLVSDETFARIAKSLAHLKGFRYARQLISILSASRAGKLTLT